MLRSRAVSSISCIICRDNAEIHPQGSHLGSYYTHKNHYKNLLPDSSFRTFYNGARVFSSAGHNISTLSISI